MISCRDSLIRESADPLIMKYCSLTSSNNSSIVEIDKTLVSALRSGVYDLTIEIVNIVTDETASREKQFFVYRAADYAQTESQPQKKPADLYLVLLTLSEEELNLEFEYTSYMATSDEEDMYEELDLEALERELVHTPVRSKQIDLEELTDEEAITALEMLGHDFYIYRSYDSKEVNVVYLRNDGKYGIIETK